MTPDIRPFDATLGAEVRGVDLSRDLDDAAFRAIERAWNHHSVLLFRDQAIDETRHLAFSRRFGDLEVHVLDQYLHPEHPEILLDLPDDEARDLLEELCTHCTRPEFVYRHRWRAGDLLMWDNIPTQHLAICDYALPQRRYMHRTTLRGTPPQ